MATLEIYSSVEDLMDGSDGATLIKGAKVLECMRILRVRKGRRVGVSMIERRTLFGEG